MSRVITHTVPVFPSMISTRTRLDPSLSPRSSGKSSHSSHGTREASEEGRGTIVRILADIDIKVKAGKPMSIVMRLPNKTSYRVLVPKVDNISSMFRGILDPGEWDVYKPHLVESVDGKDYVRWGDTKAYIPSKVFLVRYKDNSVAYALLKDVKAPENRHSWLMYVLRSEVHLINEKTKDSLNRSTRFTMEREERRAMALVHRLAICRSNNTCKEALQKACKDPSRHPAVLHAIYRVAVYLGLPSHLSWESICFENVV